MVAKRQEDGTEVGRGHGGGGMGNGDQERPGNPRRTVDVHHDGMDAQLAALPHIHELQPPARAHDVGVRWFRGPRHTVVPHLLDHPKQRGGATACREGQHDLRWWDG